MAHAGREATDEPVTILGEGVRITVIAPLSFRPSRGMSSLFLIGTGRAAFHLGQAFKRAGIRLAGISGRDALKAGALARDLDCPAFGWNDAPPESDLRVIAVSDDAIRGVSDRLPADGTPVIHLSGSKPVDLLDAHVHRGVLWPIQSFSPGSPVDLDHVPLIYDAEDPATLELLRTLGESLSGTVVHLPFAARQRLHLSAVIASNFPVFLLREAERLLREHAIDPLLVQPLWKASTEKAMLNADQAVTGPARRGDVRTIEQQIGLLEDEPELRRAYVALSDLILHTYHPDPRGHQDL